MRKVMLVLFVVCSLVIAKTFTDDNPMKSRLYDNKGMGGPDAYGYIYLDSDTTCPGAPTFNWIDISSVGTLVTGLGDDNVAGPFNIGFDFPYYWYTVNSFYVGSNGYIAFGDNTLAAAGFAEDAPPSPLRPNNMVAPLLSDFDFSVGSPSCYVWTNAANDTCIITYQNLQWWATPASNCSLQIILAKPDSSITFQYKRIIGTPGGSTPGWLPENNATGIENLTGVVGLRYLSGASPAQNALHDELAVKFIPPATTSYYYPDLSIWNAMNDVSGGFFAYRDSAKVLWANMKNSGTVTLNNCSLYCRVVDVTNADVYSNAVEIASMNPGQVQLVEFNPAWTPTVNGLYRTIFRTKVANDSFRSNDSIIIETHVVTYPCEMAYDDGTPDGYINWLGGSGGAGAKFTPAKYPCIISGALINLSNRGIHPAVQCTIAVYDDDGPGGSPGTMLASRIVTVTSPQYKWYRVFLFDTIESGSFYIGGVQCDTGCGFSYDESSPISGQAWENTGVWSPYREKNDADIMCRAMIGYEPMEDDATALEIVTPSPIITPGATVTPRALLGNYGTNDQPNLTAVMTIDKDGQNVYTGTATISLNSAQEDYADFSPTWTPGPLGTGYDVTVYTTLSLSLIHI